MKKILLTVSMAAVALAAWSPAWSQNAPLQGISESTDPAKVSDVEKRADEIRNRNAQTSGASSSASGEAGEGHHAKGKHHKARKHHGASSKGSADSASPAPGTAAQSGSKASQ